MPDKKTTHFVLSLLAGLVLVCLSLYGFILLRSRSGLPDGIKMQELVRIDDVEIQNPKDVEFVLIQKRIGDWADFELRRDGDIESVRAQVVAFYSRIPFPLIYLFIGVFCYLIGFTVFLLKWEDTRARILYWLAVAFSYSLIVSGGTYCLGHGWFSYVPVILFYLLYPLTPALLLHFSISFTTRQWRLGLYSIYSLSLLLAVFFIAIVLISTLVPSISVFRLYISAFLAFRCYMIALLLLAVFHFVLVYRRAALEENRAPIKWIFLGLLLGLSPFIFVYQIPVILKITPLLNEESSSVFFVFIPLAFALSIVRFRFLNVDVVINRGLVYSLLTIFTVSLYLLSARVLEGLFTRVFVVHQTVITIGSALLAALAFQPARTKIQGLVDRAFFRQSYDYRKAVLRFSETSQKPLRANVLIDEFIENVKAVIPVERLVLYVGEDGPQGPRAVYSRGLKGRESISAFPAQPVGRLWARRGATGTEEEVDFAQDELLTRSNLDILLPLPFQSPGFNGFLALGKKRSGQNYRRDDIELLATLAGELALSLDRLRLQEEVVYERASKEKSDELNRLKTEFIASVSHELRTPMSSIQGLIELLHEGKIRGKAKKEETLDILASESGRLSRLIHNILDFGKIEQHAKTHQFERMELGPLVEETVRVFQRRLDESGFTLRLKLPPGAVWLTADRDAIKQVLLNLLDNAIKYSPQRKELEVEVLTASGGAEVRVSDRGIGVPAGETDAIFERFHRGPEAARINPKGVGLGLKIVRHIMTAHRGEVLVEPRTGGGSTFRLIFPKG
jgi:signal transduction histidine kinase